MKSPCRGVAPFQLTNYLTNFNVNVVHMLYHEAPFRFPTISNNNMDAQTCQVQSTAAPQILEK